MGGTSIPPALDELRNPTSPEAQVEALRALKNEIVGHDQRKELAVRHGVVAPLVRILRAEARKGGKRRSKTLNGNASAPGGGVKTGPAEGQKSLEQSWSSEDEMRLQAVLVVGSLALGGPALITPLITGGLLYPMLESLSPTEVSPKLITSTLRALIVFADSASLARPWKETADGTIPYSLTTALAEPIYQKPVVDSFTEILAQTSNSPMVHQQISLVAQLIAKTCREEEQKKLLLNVGILDLLGEKLAGIATLDESLLRDTGVDGRSRTRHMLSPIYLADILDAIGAVVQKSYYRMARLLYAPAVLNVFPLGKATGNYDGSGAAYDNFASQGLETAWDRLLPRLPAALNRSEITFSKAFPALGSLTSHVLGDTYSRIPSFESLQPSTRDITADAFESPLYVWLIAKVREGPNAQRLAAARVLSLLNKFSERYHADESSKNRERRLQLCVVPILVRLIEEASPLSEQSRKPMTPQAKAESRMVLERAPAVLAELIEGSKGLQAAAFEAKVLPTLCQILKKSFDPVSSNSKPLWAPRPASPVRDPSIDQPSSTLGRPGLSTDVLHAVRYRESALKAIAAIAEREDSYRKAVIDLGAVAYITDSLTPYSDVPTTASSAKEGNPVPVLLAACNAARSLSRSVSVLRTSLIDNGLAKPVVALFRHPDVSVKTAATEVICNLTLEVSPMREDIIESGAIKTICEHCHSANTELRFNSIWALKHVVLTAPYALKVRCLEELGAGWLVQAITGDLNDYAAPLKEGSRVSTPIGMGTPNAAGEQVDLLNAVDDPNMDVDEDSSSGDEDEDTMTDSIGSLRRQRLRHTSAAQISTRLRAIKDDEQDPRITAEREDIRMQEQALQFIRNFLTEAKGISEMIDHLLNTIGHTRLFEILDSKLRPKSTSTSSYWSSTSTPRTSGLRPSHLSSSGFNSPSINLPSYPPVEILVSTTFILVHLANGKASHRSLLLSQTQLMQHLLPLFQHPNRTVRVPCAWLVNNLTWVDDHTDQAAARERAATLRALGFEERIRVLCTDVDLDVRERAKTAAEQMGKLLEGQSGLGSATGGFGSDLGRLGEGGGLSRGMGGLSGHRGWRDQ